MPTNLPATVPPQLLPVPQPLPFDSDAWIAEQARRQAAFEAELALTKIRLFDLLVTNGIVLITAAFDGSGDSGQIEAMSAFGPEGEIDFPELMLDLIEPDAPQGEEDLRRLEDVIETLAYDLLQSQHGGWEINDGSYGEFRFDVAKRTIVLEFNERFISSEYSETSW